MCSVYSLQNCLQGCQTFLLLLEIIMLLPLTSAPCLFLLITCLSASVLWHTSNFYFCFMFTFFSARSPTENWLSFSCRLWPWCISFPIRGSRILGDPEADWGKTTCGKSYFSCTIKDPCLCALWTLHINLFSSTFTYWLPCRALILRAICMLTDRKTHLHQILSLPPHRFLQTGWN